MIPGLVILIFLDPQHQTSRTLQLRTKVAAELVAIPKNVAAASRRPRQFNIWKSDNLRKFKAHIYANW